MQGKQLVALKVFNAAEAFHLGKLPGCRTLPEAQAEVLRAFKGRVRALQREMPTESTIVQMLDCSRDASGEIGTSPDGCCYLVMELGMFTMEQLVRDSREIDRRPIVDEVREAARLVLTALEGLHAANRVLAEHSPRQWMRFPAGWKLVAADALRDAYATHDLTEPGEALYRAPEFASAVAGGRASVPLTPAMDVWSVALMVLELVLPRPLFEQKQLDAQASAPRKRASAPHPFYAALAREHEPVVLPREADDFSSPFADLMRGMLERDPLTRLTASDALIHPFFAASAPTLTDVRPTPAAPPPAPTVAWAERDLGAGVGIGDSSAAEQPTGGQRNSPAEVVAVSPPPSRPAARPLPPSTALSTRAKERQSEAIRAREEALAELHAATLQLGAVQVALGAQGGGSPMVAAAPGPAVSPAGGPSPAILPPSRGDSAAAEVTRLTQELTEAREAARQAAQRAEMDGRTLRDDLSRAQAEAHAHGMALAAHESAVAERSTDSSQVSSLNAEVGRLKGEVRQLLQDSGAGEVERQQLREQLANATAVAGARPRTAEGGGDDVERLEMMRRMNEVLEEARTRTEGALKQLHEVQQRNGELEEEVGQLRASGGVSSADLKGQLDVAERGRLRAEGSLREARAALDDKVTQLLESEAKLNMANREVAASDQLRREAAGRGGDGGGLEKVYHEADQRVREVRKIAEQQLREERKRSADDLHKAELSARKVEGELRRQLTEALDANSKLSKQRQTKTTVTVGAADMEREVVELREALAVSEEERIRIDEERQLTEERLLGTAEAADMSRYAEHTLSAQLREDNERLVHEVTRLHEEVEHAHWRASEARTEIERLRSLPVPAPAPVESKVMTIVDDKASRERKAQLGEQIRDLEQECAYLRDELQRTHAHLDEQHSYGMDLATLERERQSATNANDRAARAEAEVERLRLEPPKTDDRAEAELHALHRELQNARDALDEGTRRVGELQAENRELQQRLGEGSAEETQHLREELRFSRNAQMEAMERADRATHEAQAAAQAAARAEDRAALQADELAALHRQPPQHAVMNPEHEAHIDRLRYDLEEAQQRLGEEARRADAAESQLRRRELTPQDGGAAKLADELRVARMQNVALTEDIRKLDGERERQLRELAQRKDAALLQMRTALLESEESRDPGQVRLAMEVSSTPHPGSGATAAMGNNRPSPLSKSMAAPNTHEQMIDRKRLLSHGILKVLLKKGVGLKAADMNGKSDPYVKVNAAKQEKKSKVVKSTLDPVWDEEVSFSGTLNDFLATGLLLKVFDWDSPLKMTKDDPLGDVSVSLDALKWDDGCDFAEALPTQGSLIFSVTWVPMAAHMLSHGTLHVQLSHASGLKAADANGKSDPYVKLTLAGTTKQSKTIKKTLDPVWNESFTWKGVLKDLVADPMQLHAWDYDFMSKDDPLGFASISLAPLAQVTAHDVAASLSEQGTVFLRLAWQADGDKMPPLTSRFNTPGTGAPPSQRPDAPLPTPAAPPTAATLPKQSPVAAPMPPMSRATPSAPQPRQNYTPPVDRGPVDRNRVASSGVLKVLLKKGVGLKAADMNGKSDPYVKVNAAKQEKKSKVVKSTLDPVWDEEVSFSGTLNDFLATGLLLKVFDWDSPLKMTKDDPLGDVSVSLDALKWDDGCDFAEALPTQGSLIFSVTWVPMAAHMLSHGTLHVQLSHASGLKAADANGKSDPYVKLTLAGTTKQSKTIKKTLDPVWNESFTWKGVLKDLVADPMQLHAWDYDFMSKDDPLGFASISLAALENVKMHNAAASLSEQGTVFLRLAWQADGDVAPPPSFREPHVPAPASQLSQPPARAPPTAPPPPSLNLSAGKSRLEPPGEIPSFNKMRSPAGPSQPPPQHGGPSPQPAQPVKRSGSFGGGSPAMPRPEAASKIPEIPSFGARRAPPGGASPTGPPSHSQSPTARPAPPMLQDDGDDQLSDKERRLIQRQQAAAAMRQRPQAQPLAGAGNPPPPRPGMGGARGAPPIPPMGLPRPGPGVPNAPPIRRR